MYGGRFSAKYSRLRNTETMLKGYLVYDRENAKKNTWFIENFIKTAKDFDLNIELIYTDQATKKTLPDFAVVRAISPKTNEYYEEKK